MPLTSLHAVNDAAFKLCFLHLPVPPQYRELFEDMQDESLKNSDPEMLEQAAVLGSLLAM